jgi:hypothetical protein
MEIAGVLSLMKGMRGPPCINLPVENRDGTTLIVRETSLTASPASPPQPGTASRVANKSKKADSAPPSFRIINLASVTAKTASDLITVQSNSDSDSSPTVSQDEQTVVPSVSVSQPTTAK